MIKLPEKFEESMKSLLKEDYQKYVKSMEKPAKRGLRVNSEYVLPEELCKLFSYQIKPLLNENNLFCLESDEKIGNSVFHHAGMIYLQEPSSMLAVLALDVKDGENILDLCAAPGGKTGQILEKDRTGIVVSNEIVRARANVLLSNIERQGFKNSTITSLAPETLSGLLPDFFDKILVDAPCSGEGMFRKEPETISEWNAGLPEFNHTRQLQILKEADKMLKQGGTLVYSTCTFNRKEDEETVAIFANEYGYEIVPLPENVQSVTTAGEDVLGIKTSLSRKCFPFGDFGEGQFVCKMIKKSENGCECARQNKIQGLSKNEILLAKQLLKSTIGDDDFYFYKLGDNVYISKVPLRALPFGVVSIGVCLGELKKDRIEPSHHFFKAYGRSFENKIELENNQDAISKYLSGNEIECDSKNGLAVVLFHGVPLGGGKVVFGRVKNYYPKGLRVSGSLSNRQK